MMICDADFDELFPRTRPVRHPALPAEKGAEPSAVQPVPGAADVVSLARWKDEGGPTRIRRKVGFLKGNDIVMIEKWLTKGHSA